MTLNSYDIFTMLLLNADEQQLVSNNMDNDRTTDFSEDCRQWQQHS